MFFWHVGKNGTVISIPVYRAWVDTDVSRCSNGSQLYPCTDGERLCSSPVADNNCRHSYFRGKISGLWWSWQCNQIWKHFQRALRMDSKALSQVNESYIEIFVSLEFVGPQRSCPWLVELEFCKGVLLSGTNVICRINPSRSMMCKRNYLNT